jgi:hypothetical protein
MPKIERRRKVVTLHHGNYEAELAELMDKAMAALRDEESGAAQRRHGTKSSANAYALQYDEKRKEADETATLVTVWAIGWEDMDTLQDEHLPREGEAEDKAKGVNMKTFPRALLEASMVDPDDATDLADRKTKGREALAALDLSRLHYKRLENAAWNVNVGDDALPKASLVSLLNQARDNASKPQPDSE